MKNNVTRLLEARGIPYTAFELPAEKLSALEAAQYLGVDPELVYKTIVVLRIGRGKPLLAVVPAPLEVDLKALAKAVGERKLVLATQHQAEQVTGLLTGGISPLALLNRGFEVVVDALAELYPQIYVSGGQRGLNICLPTAALISLTEAKVAEISA
ncbi:MAG TPA: YbaK/EbsC family protein [Anaerolineales bacterium]|nr:YbaK/EbsC family protein [Anaerolineales bacterium]